MSFRFRRILALFNKSKSPFIEELLRRGKYLNLTKQIYFSDTIVRKIKVSGSKRSLQAVLITVCPAEELHFLFLHLEFPVM